MRILIVTPWLPHYGITHAGGQHLYHMLESLVERGHTVHLLGYGRGETAEEMADLTALCASLTVLSPAYSWRQKLASFRDHWTHPWQLGQRTHAEARQHIRRICEQIDVVHFAWTEMGRYLDAVPDHVGTVLGSLDVEYLVRSREVALSPPGWAKLKVARRARQLKQIEQSAVPTADQTVVCSEADRAHLAHFVTPERIHVVRPWINEEAMRAITPETVVPGRLVMVGALDRIANEAAARFLTEQVWGIVRKSHAGATLRVVGANPPRWLRRRAEDDPRLTVTGWVPSLVAEWAAADIALAPSLIGGGLLVKVAQPMAAGRPVITTRLGAEGIGAPPGAICLAEDARSFASAVQRLLEDRDEWARIAAAGRGHIVDHFNWSESMDALEAVYEAAKQQW